MSDLARLHKQAELLQETVTGALKIDQSATNQKVAGSNPSGHATRESLKSLRFQGFAFFAYPSRITFAVAMGALPWYNKSGKWPANMA